MVNNQDFIQQAKDYIKDNEGFSPTEYKDTRGVRTVGTGFNLKEPHVQAAIQRIAPGVMNGIPLTEDANEKIFSTLFEQASIDAENFVGSDTYHALPDNVRTTLIDNAYQLGAPKLSAFKKYRTALQEDNFEMAATELQNSQLFRQTPERVKRGIQRIRKG